jgi:acetate kinase
MKILVLNAGSSSLKISVFDTEKDSYPFFKGEFEHFKDNECTFCYQSQKRQEKITSVQEAILAIPRILNEFGYTHFDAIGHRVAHGGDFFHEAVLITDSVLEKISVFTPLAPLHNPVNLKAIEIGRYL